ncbi:MAG: S8 family serine peptidase [Candidatus Omnitrophica bacterium]|nr:S8 family serine peptidase [Candidatus Omnitrophota bacterium]
MGQRDPARMRLGRLWRVIRLMSLLVIGLFVPRVAEAVIDPDQRRQEPPSAQTLGNPQRRPDDPLQVQHNGTVSKPRFVPGQLIVKYKSDSEYAVTECVHCLLKNRAELKNRTTDVFRATTTDASDSLDRLHAKYEVKAARPVFRTGDEETEILGPKTLTALRQHQADTAKRLKARFPQRSARAPKDAVLPDLTQVYVLEVPQETDIQAAVADFAQDPHVVYAQPNYLVEVQWTPNDPYYNSSGSWGQPYEDLWGLKKIQAAQAWEVTQGQGILVAVIDTGVDYTHPDLASNLWVNPLEIAGNGLDDDDNGYVDDTRGWDFSTSRPDPMDRYGHGTHVAGTIAAVGDNGIGIVGVAPHSTVLPVKGLNDDGNGYETNLAEAIIYAAEQGADVINNSWGGFGEMQAIRDAIRYAHASGVVVLAAAGNDSSRVEDGFFPANQQEVIAVAASTQDDERAVFSNWGEKLDVSAPGGGRGDDRSDGSPLWNILSLSVPGSNLERQLPSNVVSPGYLRLAGTSMACPHAAGVAALVIAAHSDYSNEAVRAALRFGADDVGAPGKDRDSGFGRVNAWGAVTAEPRIAMMPALKTSKLVAGTTQHVTVVLKNAWLPIAGVSATLTTSDPQIMIVTPVQSYGDFSTPGEEREANFTLVLDDAIHAGATIAFELLVSSGDGTFQLRYPFTLPISDLSIVEGWPIQLPLGSEASSPALADLDRNGTLEVIVATIEGHVYVFDHAGTLVPGWPAEIEANGDSSPVVADLDGDELPEIIVGAPGGNVYAWHGDGRPMAGWPQKTIGDVLSSPAVADLDGDSRPEVVVGTGGFYSFAPGQVYAWHHDGSLVAGWPVQFDNITWALSSPAIGDLDADGRPDIVLGEMTGKIYVWHGDGTRLAGWPVQTAGRIGLNSPALGDLDRDGRLDVVITAGGQRGGAVHAAIFAFNSDGIPLVGWPQSVEPDTVTHSSTPLVDVDGDGTPEVIVGTTAVYMWHGNGAVVEGWPVSTTGGFNQSSPVAGDLDGDGKLEVVIPTTDGKVYAWHGDGRGVSGWPITTAEQFYAPVALGDLDRNGKVDVVAVSIQGKLFRWEINPSTPDRYEVTPGVIYWPTYCYNQRHTSRYDDEPPFVQVVKGQQEVRQLTSAEGDVLMLSIIGNDSDRRVLSVSIDNAPPGSTTVVLGDLDQDGTPGPPDYALLHNYRIGRADLNQAQRSLADMDSDGLLTDNDELYLILAVQGFSRIRRLTWTPTREAIGNHTVTAVATDGAHRASQTISVTIIPVNHPPVLDPIGHRVVNENQLLTVTVSATDPDGDALVFEASGLPVGASFDRGIFTWTPTSTQAGRYPLTLTVTDASGLSDTETVTVTVRETTLAISGQIVHNAGQPISGLLIQLTPSLQYPDGRKAEATTGSDGSFLLSDLQSTTKLQQAVSRCQRTGVCRPVTVKVRPQKRGVRFTPAYRTITFDSANLKDATSIDFTAP